MSEDIQPTTEKPSKVKKLAALGAGVLALAGGATAVANMGSSSAESVSTTETPHTVSIPKEVVASVTTAVPAEQAPVAQEVPAPATTSTKEAAPTQTKAETGLHGDVVTQNPDGSTNWGEPITPPQEEQPAAPHGDVVTQNPDGSTNWEEPITPQP